MAKAEFKWDKETKLGVVEVNEKEVRMLSLCQLGEKEYISIQTVKYFKKKGQEEQWNFVKNATFPKDIWQEIAEIVAEEVDFDV